MEIIAEGGKPSLSFSFLNSPSWAWGRVASLQVGFPRLILNFGFDRSLFQSVRNEFHGNNKIPCYEGNPKNKKIKLCSSHFSAPLVMREAREKFWFASILSDSPAVYS